MRVFGRAIYSGLGAVWVFAAICISARAAYAYVDPGSGLFFLRVIGSTFLGFTYLVRKRVRQFFVRSEGKQKATQTDMAAD